IAALRPDLRDAWIKRLAAWLRENVGGFRNDPDVENRAARFTVSFERLLRVSGGVWLAELKPLFEDDKTYSFGRKIDEYWYMPKLWKERMPRFVQTGREFKYADSVARGKRPKRYDECARGTLGSESDGYRDEIYEKFLELGRELGILRRSESSKLGSKWGFSPDALVIETDVDRYVQEGTRRVFYAPKSESAIWDGAECYAWDACAVCRLDSKDADGEEEASRRFYESADVCRIVAREHTSLLDRADREALEKDFIAGSDANPAATNLLSCTPTLEMGVDIGDLSSVALCSVPPTRANFVQRVGRGGRRDGNSFNLVVAANRPRDLYYFNDPAEAFDGPIDPPGVFLNAPTVLERQLLAYAFDRWIQTELDAAKGGAAKRLVPMNLKTLFAARKNDVERAFPRNLFAFAERARDSIFDGFCALFGGVMRGETKEALRKFFIDGQSENGYQWKIEEKLERTAALRDGYAAKGAEVGKKLRELEKEVESDAIKLEKQNLRDERRALAKARDLIDKITTYEYFTDEGLLPNYAFPEEGMKLRTALWRRRNTKQDADEEEREPIAEEYSRAARAAISELAPGNNFYAGGRKLLVNRIDTAGQFEIERWRFCGDCGCVRKLSDSDTKGKCCPKCGSATWSGGNQTRNVVRLDRVVAEQEESETRAFDESDRRVPKLFSRKMLIEYVGNEPDVGFRLADESVPFGFEYWSKARFRDVNFGEPGDALAGDALRIAGEDVPAVGFRVCAECGMVTPPDKEPRHHVSCKYFRSDKSAQTPDCLYLYREFESEALRMPIPVVESYSASFVAAVRMALQEFFKGNVGHLRVAVQNESVDDSKVARRFLTVYDEVPGGTGYLKQFCELPNDLLEAFKLARDRLQKCACGRDSDKDGCYRCILAYANDKDVVNVSRSRALDALDAVLEYARDGEPFKKIVSVGALNYSSLVESELEEMFTQKFEEYAAANSGLNVAITKKLVHGTKGYLLTVGETSYEITRQKELGPANGVDVPSRADLYITPTRENTGALPIAVFTDGYEYHGNPSKDMYFRVVKDASQRSAIARSKSVPRLCWSLSYDDVAHAGAKPTFWAPLAPLECVKTKKSPAPEIWRIARLGAFEALLERLARPKLGGAKWQDLAFFAAISPEPGSAAGLDRFSFITESSAAGMWSALLEGLTYSKFASRASEVFSAGRDVGVFYKPLSPRVYCAVFYPNGKQHDELGGKRAAVVLDDSDAKSVDPEEFKFDWNTWLDAYNLLQFIPGAYMTTVSALREGSPLPLWDDAVFKSVAPSPDDAVWREAESEIDGLDGALEALGAARALGWEPPETWSDAEGRDGAALGSAPLLWRARRTLWTDDPSLREAAEREGWTFFTTEQN
ncbi:MAG: DUF1998 domain-containing protein, partial [Thermoguttaceae bacterium]|nr:DUF1998 domain-containing protein [Thermoguttaceae bacterium]